MKKKIVSLLLALAVATMLSACGEVKNVQELIDSIGEVSLESEDAIVAAESTYSELSEDNKAKVENYSVLTEARANYDAAVVEDKYANAKAAFETGAFDEAEAIFAELGDYQDSAEMVTKCEYEKANTLYASGEYESELTIYETIADYSDVQGKIADTNKAIMFEKYGDVLEIMVGNAWYFNGGSDATVNSISFTEDAASIAQVYWDGNGINDNGSNEFAYDLDDTNINITLADGSAMAISYQMADGTLTLGAGNEYMTIEQVESNIQGYWEYRETSTILGSTATYEYHICFDEGKVKSESATKSSYSGDGYFYFGPESGSYTLTFGAFKTDMRHGSDYGWNIIDGEIVILRYGKVMKKSSTEKFPGQNGYKF